MKAEDLLAAHRANNPHSRAIRLVRYCKNTSATKQEQCVLCGERGPTWAAKWPQTKRAVVWAAGHIKTHLVR